MTCKKYLIGIAMLLGFVSLPAKGVGIPNLKEGETFRVSKNIDLKGQEWHLPKGAILIGSKRGNIKNGQLIGNHCSLRNIALYNVRMKGQFKEVVVTLSKDVDSLVLNGSTFTSLSIDGKGHRATITCLGKQRGADIALRNIILDCKSSSGPFLYPISEGTNRFLLEDCQFTNIPEIELLCIRGALNPEIRNCKFYGLVTKSSKRHRSTLPMIRFYGCHGDICFDGNVINNCFGIALDGIGHSEATNNIVKICNNVIDSVTNGGVVFNGGTIHNVTVENNRISNVHCLGSQFEKEAFLAENAVINFHGFKNLRIQNNIIRDCPYAYGLDLDGTLSSDLSVCKGETATIRGNKWERVLTTILFGVRDVQLTDNTFLYAGQSDVPAVQNGLSLNSCYDITITNNSITAYRAGNEVYPIVIGQNRNRTSGTINIKGNTIKSDGDISVMVRETFSGTVKQGGNTTISTRTKKPLKVVDRSAKVGNILYHLSK